MAEPVRLSAALPAGSPAAVLTLVLLSIAAAVWWAHSSRGSRRGLRLLREASAATQWPVAEVEQTLMRFADRAVGPGRSRCRSATGRGSTRRVLRVPFGVRRELEVRAPRLRPWIGANQREVLTTLAALATTAQLTAAREAALRQQMSTDALTGLWSYPRFRAEMRSLARQTPPGDQWAVLFLDVDHFKTINTRLGHLDADEVLRELGRRLGAPTDPPLLCGRFAGDEFLVGFHVPNGDPARVAQVVAALTGRVRQPMRIGGQLLQLNASAGSYLSADDQADVDVAIRQAEAAMRAAKRASATHGPPRWVDERRRIRDLLDDREIRVNYQPILDLQKGLITGFEALVRVSDPVLGPISPETLVDAAARIRLLDELTLLISEQAGEAMSALAGHCEHRLRLSLNLEFEQLRSDNVTLSWLVERFDEAPVDLMLELTERHSLQWTRAHEDVARGLRRQGIELAIDDFGAGYATYQFLDSWDWSVVKIDRSLVGAADRSGQLLLRHVAGLLRDLGTTAVAEGVETAAQLELVGELGIRYAQGYHLGRPMTATEALDRAAAGWLRDPLGPHRA